MACDLRLDEHTAQMYVFSNIASFDHVTHNGGHIKDRLARTFNQSSHHQYRIWAWASDECPVPWVIGDNAVANPHFFFLFFLFFFFSLFFFFFFLSFFFVALLHPVLLLKWQKGQERLPYRRHLFVFLCLVFRFSK